MKRKIGLACLALLFFSLTVLAPVSATELSREAKAKLFAEIAAAPLWCEVTVDLSPFKEKGDKKMAKAREMALTEAENRVNALLVAKIAAQKELEIRPETIDLTACLKLSEEDASEKYGKVFRVKEDGKKINKVSYRFKLQCQKVAEINPFLRKPLAAEKGAINKFSERQDYWEFIAAGYAFYEGFEDIETKVKIAAARALDNGCEAIIAKAAELGVTDETVQEKIREKIKEKKDYQGFYGVPGCGVKLEVVLPVRINKKDAAVSFMPE